MKYFTKTGDVEREFVVERRGGEIVATSGDRIFRLDYSRVGDGSTFSLLVDGHSYDFMVDWVDGGVAVEVQGERVVVQVEDQRERAAHVISRGPAAGQRQVRSPMPGTVVEIRVRDGQDVEEGDTLLILEAMKMRNPVRAEGPGRVSRLRIEVGQAVAGGELLLDLE